MPGGRRIVDETVPPSAREGRLEGRQSWRDLLFLHWSVPAEELRPVVPVELPLDLRDGVAWVGVVAFSVHGARPPLVPSSLGLDFLETNARTYVRLPGGEPAVWFFSLDAESRVAVAAARLRYGLPYHAARMRRGERDGWVAYSTTRRSPARAGLEVDYQVGEPAGTAPPGSLEEFLVERYALHVVRGGLHTVRVRHDPYPLRRAEARVRREDLLAAAGVRRPEAAPLVHFSDGVDVEVRAVGGG